MPATVGSSARGSPACCSRAWPLTAAPAAAQTAPPPDPDVLAPETPQPDAPRSVAVGRPWHGRLQHGVQLPAAGTDFVTWDPILGQSPNRDWRRWGTDALIVVLDTVTREFREAHPGVPPILIADLSRPQGGPFGRALWRARPRLAPERPRRRRHVPAARRRAARGAAPGRGRSRAGAGPRRSLPRRRRGQALRRARTCTCAARARSSCRSSTTTTTSTCGSRTPADRTRLDRAPHEEHRHAQRPPLRAPRSPWPWP